MFNKGFCHSRPSVAVGAIHLCIQTDNKIVQDAVLHWDVVVQEVFEVHHPLFWGKRQADEISQWQGNDLSYKERSAMTFVKAEIFDEKKKKLSN